jgi:hypothetical protein
VRPIAAPSDSNETTFENDATFATLSERCGAYGKVVNPSSGDLGLPSPN